MARTMVIFGASGDLTSRKLIPALYLQFQRGKLPETTRVVGVWREVFFLMNNGVLRWPSRHRVLKMLLTMKVGKGSLPISFHVSGDINAEADFANLASRLSEVEQHKPTDRIYYVATMPQLYETAAAQLGKAGLADDAKCASNCDREAFRDRLGHGTG